MLPIEVVVDGVASRGVGTSRPDALIAHGRGGAFPRVLLRAGSQDKYNSFSPSISVVRTTHCLCHFLYKICQFVHSLGAIRTLRSTPVSPKWKAHLPRFVRHPQPTSRRATAAGRPMDKSCQNIHIPP